ncbi:MAG: hypothetical protein NTZ83_01010 [Candidatus Pacearchaeota archaeon]|nr:hypothetical protein [Candidatus Pacearchaeota archaeon]
MAKYNLILKTVRDDEPREFFALDVEGPRVPVKGEMIDSMGIAKNKEKIAVEKHNTKYVSNFAYSKFIVNDVIHIPEYIKGRLETQVNVIAIKI